MTVLNLVLLSVAMVLGLVPVLLTARLKARLRDAPTADADDWLPVVAMIVPCKGIDPGFRENVEAVLAQDYPNRQVVFVVATDADPAYGALCDILGDKSRQARNDASIAVAGLSPKRAEKLTNQLAGLQQVRPEAVVLVFIDSDCRPDPGFVRRLITPLRDPKIGATTGYRWYHPPQPTLGSLLRSTWNAGALPFLFDRKRVFAWGGAMALRRDTFQRAGVARLWDTAVSDDMTLTNAVRGLGLELEFVPSCIAVSYEPSSIAETIEFTNRQSVISRVYFPPLWWGTALGHAFANLLLLYGIACGILWLNSQRTVFLIGTGCLLLLPLQLANAWWLFGSARTLLPQRVRSEVQPLRWRYVLTAPLTSMMTLINTVHSTMTRTIVWRGVQYELVSPEQTIVRRNQP